MSATEVVPGEEQTPGRRRRRHRRVVAPPTRPDADQSDEVPPSGRPSVPVGRLDARDAWILEQRPPHWD